MNVTVTGVLFQPLAFGAGEITEIIVGGVGATVWILSVTVSVAEFPALSDAVPVNTWLRPGLFTVIGWLQFATPESASEQLKVIVTGVDVMIPFALGAGTTVCVIVGGVRSRFTVAQAGGDEFPAASTACPQKVCPLPSVAT